MKTASLSFSGSVLRMAAVCGVVLLTACAYTRPTAEARKIAFPLDTCTAEHLAQASQRVLAPSAASVSREWVCVTAPLDVASGGQTDVVGGTGAGAGTQAPGAAAVRPFSGLEKQRLETQALNNPDEAMLRRAVEAPLTRNGATHPALGIALSGGGTKAAAFATGVLAGLSDAQLLDSADYISSVSGGGYAAYFYYAHKVFPLVRAGVRPTPSTQDIFRDCVVLDPSSVVDGQLRATLEQAGYCRPDELLMSGGSSREPSARDNRYQAFLRCQQDVFNPGRCKTEKTSGDFGIAGGTLISNILSMPFSNLANTVFDWGVSMSPAAKTYHDGIGLAYGSSISDLAALAAGQSDRGFKPECVTDPVGSERGRAIDCVPGQSYGTPVPLTFEELRQGMLAAKQSTQGALPFWIINATATRDRSLFGWWSTGEQDTTNSDAFEMTAVSHGSGRYGYVSAPLSMQDMSVLNAVASSAAFLDPNQLKYTQATTRGLYGVGQRLFNLDWGVDIANYNVSDKRRSVHQAMPVPLYGLDSHMALKDEAQVPTAERQDRQRSAFIRLIDGGNAENLGLYTLVKRGTRNVVVSDAAQDTHGNFGDICAVARRLRNAPEGTPRYLYMPGLADFDAHCAAIFSNVEKADEVGYDVRQWTLKYPVVLGCLRRDAATNSATPCTGLAQDDVRLFVVKPAVDYSAWRGQVALEKGSAARVVDCSLVSTTTPEGMPLNCGTTAFMLDNLTEGNCSTFPQHKTVAMTANSSATLFAAYRDLARQYVNQAAPLIRELSAATPGGIAQFDRIVAQQAASPMMRQQDRCVKT